MEAALLSPSRIYIPQETPASVGRQLRRRRALMTVVELICVSLFVAAVLVWAGQGGGR